MINPAVHSSSVVLWKLTSSRSHRANKATWPHVGLIVVALSIAVLYWPVTRWTLDKFLQSSLHWHWFVAALSIVCAARASTHRFKPGVNNSATVLLLVCTLVELANQRTLQIHLLSAVLLIVSLHAYTGHLIPNSQWRSMKWPMVVGVALLPLDFYLEPYFGYPLRLFTASVAHLVFQGFGFEALSSQSILLVENRASVVDLDCSGINSLWAGAVFYLLLSWLSRLSVGIRWWLLGLLLVALLLVANVARIVVLVFLDLHSLGGLSEIAHTSMGAVGFALSIVIVWKLAERIDKVAIPACPDDQQQEPALSWRWPLLPVAAVLLIAAAVPNSDQHRVEVTHDNIVLPVALAAKPIDLSEVEQVFFNKNQADAMKYQLGDLKHNDSLVLVTSNWWKAQHKPDHCLQAMGFSIQRSSVLTFAPDDSTRSINAVTVLNIVDEKQNPYTAVYWFQSADLLTADHYRRMADTFRHPNRSWTMVSLLLSGDHKSDQISARVAPIRQSIANSYKDQK